MQQTATSPRQMVSLFKQAWRQMGLAARCFLIIQLLGAVGLGIPQAIKCFQSIEGVSLGANLVITLFLATQAVLAWNSYKAKPDPTAMVQVVAYAWWTCVMMPIILATVANPNYQWVANDTYTIAGALLLFVIVLIQARLRNVPKGHPQTKGFVGIAFKVFPQIMMALRILEEGGGGISVISVVFGNLNIALRITSLYWQRHKQGGELNNTWNIRVDWVNWASWAIVTFVVWQSM